MTDIYLDPITHDLVLDGRDLRLTATTNEDVVQRLKIKLQFLLDEWFLDTSIGIPYTQTIFDSSYNDLDSIYALLRTEIINTEGVEVINEMQIDLDRDERILNISLKVNQTIELEVTI